ncbi:uncharacterized protein LOC106468780 [Limulus polyphemus]|uniref:Uncharacterized protein LOC106468780 n=1 Tax=Limulus polyphemus TaxID=6850 RepID=A0ABM1BLZ5_LIMPO|nr:uncharacterized protein LOC106468780 [Limulus polyphemus]
MKVLISVVVFLCLNVTVLCQTPPPRLCKLNEEQLKKYVECERREFPVWVLEVIDKCINEIMPGATNLEVVRKACEDGETARMLFMCVSPSIKEIEDELNQLVEKCAREAEG